MLPKHLDEKVARLHLDALGVKLTELRPSRPPTSACRSRARTSRITTGTRGGTGEPRRAHRLACRSPKSPIAPRRRGRGAHRVGGRADAGAALDPRALRRASARWTGCCVGACLHVTAETANLVARAAGGRRGGRRCARPTRSPRRTTWPPRWSSTTASRCARCAARTPAAYAENLAALVARGPQVTVDDGADLIVGAPRRAPPSCSDELLGGTEETDHRARAPAGDARPRAASAARSSRSTRRAPSALFNDRYGTGQSTLDGILRATNLLLAGRTVVVLGYGWAGKRHRRCAPTARARSVIVCEVDPMRALEARMDGFEVMPALEAAERGDVFVTVTGARDVLVRAHFERMKDGAVLANAGHFDVEIDLEDLRAVATGGHREVRPLVERVRPRRPAPEPAGLRPGRQPRRRRGPPRRRDGHVLRQPGARGRVPRRRGPRPRARRAPRARGHRRRDRAPEARLAGRRDRRADARAARVPARVESRAT